MEDNQDREMRETPNGSKSQSLLPALGLFTVLTVLLLSSVVTNLTARVPALGLNYVLLANQRLFLYELQRLSSPLKIDWVLFPAGYTIHEGLFPTTLAALGGGWVDPLLGLNFSILFSFLVASLGTYRLALELAGDRRAALLAGLYFGFGAQHVANLDTYPVFHIEWVPWFFLALACAFRGGPRRMYFWLGLFFFLASLCSWYFSVFLLLASLIYCAVFLVSKRRLGPVPGVLLAISAAGLCLLPFSPAALLREYGLDAGGTAYFVNGSADLLSFFVPPGFHWYWGQSATHLRGGWLGNPSLSSNFFGYLTALIVLAGVISRKKGISWERTPLLLIGGVFLVLSLGPFLIVGGLPGWSPSEGIAGLGNWKLPYYWLVDIFPFSVTRATARYSAVSLLVAAVFLANGAVWVASRPRLVKRTRAVFVLMFLIVMLELWPSWPLRAEIPVPVPESYSRSESGVQEAVLQVPFRINAYRYLWDAATAGRRIVGGAVDKPFRRFERQGQRYPLLRQLVYLGTPVEAMERYWDVHGEAVNTYVPGVVASLNIREVVLHKWNEHVLSYGDFFEPDPMAEPAAELLENWFTKRYEDSNVIVYDPPAVPARWVFPVFGAGWSEAEQHAGYVDRPVLGGSAELLLISSGFQRARIAFELATVFVPTRLYSLSLNGELIASGELRKMGERGEWEKMDFEPLILHAGRNVLRLETPGQVLSNREAYGGSDDRQISFLLRHMTVVPAP